MGRGTHGLAMERRAQQQLDQPNQAMAATEQIIALPAEFAPETSQRTFNLMGTDFVEFILLPTLMATLAAEAPNLQIFLRTPDPTTAPSMMAAGEIDLGVGYCPNAPEELIKRTLFREPFVCVARRDNSLLRDGNLSLDRYVELQHVQVLPGSATMFAAAIDTALAAMGLVRKVALWEPSFLAVAGVVARTDLISTVPKRLATYVAQGLPIAIHDLPLPLPRPEFAMYWHPRNQSDAGHQWLREKVAALL